MSEFHTDAQQERSYQAVTLGALLDADAVLGGGRVSELSRLMHRIPGDGFGMSIITPILEAADAFRAAASLANALKTPAVRAYPQLAGPFDPVALQYLGGAGSVLARLRDTCGLSLAPVAVPADVSAALHF